MDAPNPRVSMRTIHMAGILVDVYGLAELSSIPTTSVTCLWLHHPRGKNKDDMTETGVRVVSDWNERRNLHRLPRGMVALAFDQRNHGSRIVDEMGSGSWREGNKNHAVDMYGIVTGMVSDNRGLMDVVEGYLSLAVEDGKGAEWKVDQHLVLGVSLGGHSAWQLMFGDERVTAGVEVIGCPDYISLLSDRARLSRLPTFKASDNGSSFVGSRDFPPDLVKACLKADPKSILFGTGDVVISPDEEEQRRLRPLLDARIRGKIFLVCSGAVDKVVPYATSRPFLDFLVPATRTWYSDGGVSVQNKIYEGVGHTYTGQMLEDACEFLLQAVSQAPGGTSSASLDESKAKM